MTLICGSSPRNTTSPPSLIPKTPSKISTIVLPPPIKFFLKIINYPHSKRKGRHRQQSIVLYPDLFFTYRYMYVYYPKFPYVGVWVSENNWYLIYLPQDICFFRKFFVFEVFITDYFILFLQKIFLGIVFENFWGGTYTTSIRY